MIADKSRHAVLVYALLAVRTIALGTPTALAANAEGAPPLHSGPWPIHNGRNYQPTEDECVWCTASAWPDLGVAALMAGIFLTADCCTSWTEARNMKLG
jgi:hypothetical protein